MKTRVLLIIFSLLTIYSEAQNRIPLHFFSENIDFNLDEKHFSVNGIFAFCNPGDKDLIQKIIFPFADYTRSIDSIRIADLREMKLIPFLTQDKSIIFNLKIPAQDTTEINIYYRQPSSDINEYILLSTQTWHKPLEKAVYSLTVAKNIRIVSFSYQPDSVYETNNQKVYLWKKADFMPERNFIIRQNR